MNFRNIQSSLGSWGEHDIVCGAEWNYHFVLGCAFVIEFRKTDPFCCGARAPPASRMSVQGAIWPFCATPRVCVVFCFTRRRRKHADANWIWNQFAVKGRRRRNRITSFWIPSRKFYYDPASTVVRRGGQTSHASASFWRAAPLADNWLMERKTFLGAQNSPFENAEWRCNRRFAYFIECQRRGKTNDHYSAKWKSWEKHWRLWWCGFSLFLHIEKLSAGVVICWTLAKNQALCCM